MGPVQDRTYWDQYKTVLTGTRTRQYLLGPVQDRTYGTRDPYKPVLSGTRTRPYLLGPGTRILTGTRRTLGSVQDRTY